MLPLEIWEYVFLFLDVTTLYESVRLVCICWNQLIPLPLHRAISAEFKLPNRAVYLSYPDYLCFFRCRVESDACIWNERFTQIHIWKSLSDTLIRYGWCNIIVNGNRRNGKTTAIVVELIRYLLFYPHKRIYWIGCTRRSYRKTIQSVLKYLIDDGVLKFNIWDEIEFQNGSNLCYFPTPSKTDCDIAFIDGRYNESFERFQHTIMITDQSDMLTTGESILVKKETIVFRQLLSSTS